MAVLELFKKLALNTHYNVDVKLLVNNLPAEIQSAVLNGDGESLKTQISGSVYLANESHVVQV
jgi:hypothetical protein